MLTEFKSKNAVIFLGAGASYADGGVLESDLLPGIHELRSLTMNIPASDFAKDIGIPNPTFSYVLAYLLDKLKQNPPNSDELRYIYTSMIEGLLNVLSFSGGLKVKNELHIRLFTHCLNHCEKFSVTSLNYDPIAESALIELFRNSDRHKLKFWIDFEDALSPLPKRPPFLKPPMDPNEPRLGSWWECENTKVSIKVALGVTAETKDKLTRPPTKFDYKHNIIDFLKLHGSARWLICESCRTPHTAIPPYSTLLEAQVVEGTIWMIGHHFPGYCALLCTKCGFPLRANIMPPGPERLRSQYGLVEVWDKTLTNLMQADDWLFIGYSFPQYDKEIRSLLELALEKRQTTPKVWIIDYFKNSYDTFNECPVVARARDIFGKNELVKSRTNLSGLQHFPKFGG